MRLTHGMACILLELGLEFLKWYQCDLWKRLKEIFDQNHARSSVYEHGIHWTCRFDEIGRLNLEHAPFAGRISTSNFGISLCVLCTIGKLKMSEFRHRSVSTQTPIHVWVRSQCRKFGNWYLEKLSMHTVTAREDEWNWRTKGRVTASPDRCKPRSTNVKMECEVHIPLSPVPSPAYSAFLLSLITSVSFSKDTPFIRISCSFFWCSFCCFPLFPCVFLRLSLYGLHFPLCPPPCRLIERRCIEDTFDLRMQWLVSSCDCGRHVRFLVMAFAWLTTPLPCLAITYSRSMACDV